MSIPRPTTEEECAAQCGYFYSKQNIINYKLVIQQEKCIRKENKKAKRSSLCCNCKIINGRKCNTIDCENRSNNVSCGEDCSPNCFNCPWNSKEHGFVAGRKTYLVKHPEKGACIFAYEEIDKDDFIGEYVGHVRPANFKLSAKHQPYTMYLGTTGQIICGQGIGSIATRINHSCRPNCRAYIYQHEQRYKVVIVATRTIQKDEELTLNYGWTFIEGKEQPKTPCLCGHGGQHFIEKPIKPSTIEPGTKKRRHKTMKEDDDQEIFSSIAREPELQAELKESILPKERPVGYYETHVFKPRHEVFLITCNHNGVLQPTGGRVMECYMNPFKIKIIVVSTNIERRVTHHVPRFLCFRYAEDAIFRLQRLTEKDKQRVQRYTTQTATLERANKLNNRLVLDYIKLFLDDQIESAGQVVSSQQGEVTIFDLLPTTLIVEDEHPQRDSDIDADDEAEEEKGEENDWNAVVQSKTSCSQVLIPTQTEPRPPSNQREPEMIEEVIDQAPTTQGISDDQPARKYDPTFRRELHEIRDQVGNELQFYRTLQHAIENVTFYALSRLHKEREITFLELQPSVRRELEFYYVQAPTDERHFLIYGHYHHAIEVLHPGSRQLRWCSLCRLATRFASDEQMRRHYYRRHSIVATTYTCPGCNERFILPSQIRNHVDHCLPHFASTLVSTVPSHIMDAYADYHASNGSTNHPTDALNSGFPNLVNSNISQDNHQIQMDKITDRPIDNMIQIQSTELPINTKPSIQISSWDDIKSSVDKKTDLDLNAENLLLSRSIKLTQCDAIVNRKVIDGLVIDDQLPGTSRTTPKNAGESGRKKKRSKKGKPNSTTTCAPKLANHQKPKPPVSKNDKPIEIPNQRNYSSSKESNSDSDFKPTKKQK